jgi:hypothetical protein
MTTGEQAKNSDINTISIGFMNPPEEARKGQIMCPRSLIANLVVDACPVVSYMGHMTSKKTKAERKVEPSFLLAFKARIVGLEGSCKVCGSPLHPATSDGTFCGPCIRSLLKGLAEIAHPDRTCSGVKFYEHAKAPPA